MDSGDPSVLVTNMLRFSILGVRNDVSYQSFLQIFKRTASLWNLMIYLFILNI